jgi:hypothetical protein
MKHIVTFFLCLFLICLANGQIPNKISYQGLLITSASAPVQDGSYDLRFEFFNASSGGTLRHSENHTGVILSHGAFSLTIGPLPMIFSEPLYIEVTATSGPGIISPITFSPRSELTSAPYSLSPWVPTGSNVVFTTGNVGIGVATPLNPLHVNGAISQGTWSTSSKYFVSEPYNNDSWRLQAFKNYGTTPLALNPAGGNVGIGTATPTEKLEVNGNIKAEDVTIGIGGTPITRVLSLTIALNFPSTNAQSNADLLLTVTGAIPGDVVSLGLPDISVPANSCYTAWVSAYNEVTVRFNNYSAAAQNPLNGTFRIMVTQF